MLDPLRKKISQLGLPSWKSMGMTALFLMMFLVVFELALQSNFIVRALPFPSPSLESHYPEIGVKFERLFQVKGINCLFFGSSMIDAGLDPVLFEKGLEAVTGRQYTCFNMGLAGVQTEASTAVASTLTHWYPVEIVVIGLSPLDLSSNFTKTRPIAQMPVFTYYERKPTIEGFLFNHFRLPWYFASLSHVADTAYLKEQVEWDELLTDRGIRLTTESNQVQEKDQEVTLLDYRVNPTDAQALDTTLANFKSRGIQSIVIEFPVHPVYYPYLVEGGETAYQDRFIKPVKEITDRNEVEFIHTQRDISSIVTETDWFNRNHLNITGAEKFTRYILDKLRNEGGVK
ncbi:hypothetical protein hrd7_01030 [Leptolinea sp. HRD-7]|nr:hypothetical protein hrd7_01030 [Leptolinea sp. HRD-7]